MPPFSSIAKHSDIGLLIMRVGLGAMFIGHGAPKLMGGPATWAAIGGAMKNLGLDFAPTFWGLMAALAESGGGLLLILGLWTRAACLLLSFTMLVASIKHLSSGDGFVRSSHAIESLIVFVGLFVIGPGRHSLDNK